MRSSGNVLAFRPRIRKRMDKKTKAAVKVEADAEANPVPVQDKTPKKITIKLPTYIYLALVDDAEKNRRTLAKQLETILAEHFRFDIAKKSLFNGVQWVAENARKLSNE